MDTDIELFKYLDNCTLSTLCEVNSKLHKLARERVQSRIRSYSYPQLSTCLTCACFHRDKRLINLCWKQEHVELIDIIRAAIEQDWLEAVQWCVHSSELDAAQQQIILKYAIIETIKKERVAIFCYLFSMGQVDILRIHFAALRYRQPEIHQMSQLSLSQQEEHLQSLILVACEAGWLEQVITLIERFPNFSNHYWQNYLHSAVHSLSSSPNCPERQSLVQYLLQFSSFWGGMELGYRIMMRDWPCVARLLQTPLSEEEILYALNVSMDLNLSELFWQLQTRLSPTSQIEFQEHLEDRTCSSEMLQALYAKNLITHEQLFELALRNGCEALVHQWINQMSIEPDEYYLVFALESRNASLINFIGDWVKDIPIDQATLCHIIVLAAADHHYQLFDRYLDQINRIALSRLRMMLNNPALFRHLKRLTIQR